MPDTDIMLMQDIEDTSGVDTEFGSDIIWLHVSVINTEDLFYQSQSVTSLETQTPCCFKCLLIVP